MKRRRGEIQVFSMSFLDVLSCALGGTLLLLLLVQEGQQQEAEAKDAAMKQTVERMQQALADMKKAVDDAEQAKRKADKAQREADAAMRQARTAKQKAEAIKKQLAAAKQRQDAQQKAISQLKRAKQALVGIGGKKENLVFVFDTSGSMKGNFNYYVSHLVKLIHYLDFNRFNVIDYDHRVRVWQRGRMMDGGVKANRNSAEQFTTTFKADGITDTMAALKTAAALPGVDTIILFSDGDPFPRRIYDLKKATLQKTAMATERSDIITWAKSLRGRVVINTVIVGQRHTPTLRKFLKELAEATNGTVQALP